MKPPKHLVQITDRLFVTHGAYYAPQYRKEVDKYLRAIKKAIPLIEAEIGCNIPRNLKVLIKPIRAKNVRGVYTNINKTIAIDPRSVSVEAIINTLAHEYIHVRQYETGRLSHDLHPNGLKSLVYKWEGRHFIKARDYKMYFIQPWEIEAREEGSRIAKVVLSQLKE